MGTLIARMAGNGGAAISHREVVADLLFDAVIRRAEMPKNTRRKDAPMGHTLGKPHRAKGARESNKTPAGADAIFQPRAAHRSWESGNPDQRRRSLPDGGLFA